MDNLKELLREAMLSYTGIGLNVTSYLTVNEDQNLFAVIDLSDQKEKRLADTSLIARVFHDWIIIDCDINNKPLVDMLEQMGVPRAKIILAYLGEQLTEDDLVKDVLHKAIMDYAARREYSTSSNVVTVNEDKTLYVVTTTFDDHHPPSIKLMVRFQDGQILIEHNGSDTFDKMLFSMGIPREKIILAYAGETLPNAETTSET